MWSITKIIKKGDYFYCVCKEHPKATKHGYVLHHRVVVENHLGRLLTRDEIVHHKNHDKKDNRIENLEIMSLKEHAKLHVKRGRKTLTLTCPVCNIKFLREVRQIKKDTTPKCSRRCNGKQSKNLIKR